MARREGLNRLPENSHNLLDLQRLTLNKGNSYTANTGDREHFLVFLGGRPCV